MGFNLDAFLTVPEHDILNHAGLSGIFSGIKILGPPSGEPDWSATINAALADPLVHEVILRTGGSNQYLCTGEITVPAFKCLRGFGTGGQDGIGNGSPFIQSSTTTIVLRLNNGSRFENLDVFVTGTAGVPVIQGNAGPAFRLLKNVNVDVQGGRQLRFLDSQGGRILMENVFIRLRSSSLIGANPIIHWGHSNGQNIGRGASTFRNVTIDCEVNTHTRAGFVGQDALIENCRLINTGPGFQVQSQFVGSSIQNCYITNPNGHSIEITGPLWHVVTGNKIINAIGFRGIQATAALGGGGHVGVINNNQADNCTGGPLNIGSGYIQTGNTNT